MLPLASMSLPSPELQEKSLKSKRPTSSSQVTAASLVPYVLAGLYATAAAITTATTTHMQQTWWPASSTH